MSDYRLTLPPVGIDNAEPAVEELLQQAKSKLGFVPNMYANMANAPSLLKSYLFGYERFREESLFSPVEQEVLFLTISRDNSCHYCVAAHSAIADMASGVPEEVTNAIRDDMDIPDAKLNALHTFTRTMLTTRGRPSERDVKGFLDAGYSERHVLEVIGFSRCRL